MHGVLSELYVQRGHLQEPPEPESYEHPGVRLVGMQASNVAEGKPEVTVAKDSAFMARYFADYRFFLQQIGACVAFVHVEPAFWGYAE